MSDPTEKQVILKRVLGQFGWGVSGGFRNVVEYWEPRAGAAVGLARRDTRVIVPLDASKSDYDQLIIRAMDQLREYYGGALSGVVSFIEMAMAKRLDEVDFQRETGNGAGLITWLEGNQMVDSARGLLSSAAKATNRSRKRFANAQTVVAEDFLSSCYMGQTRIGSYVVTALAPADATFATSRSEAVGSKRHPRIQGRQITEKLSHALHAVREAVSEVRRNDDVATFENYIVEGVSFELLSSLEQLIGDVDAGITINLYNSHGDTAPVPDSRSFVFTPEDAVVIERAKTFFGEAPEPVKEHVTGEVVSLKNSSMIAEHQIRLRASVNGKLCTVMVNLSAEHYEQAVEAHRRKVLFSVSGELEQRTRGSLIDVPDSVRVETTPIIEVSSEVPPQTLLWSTSSFG